MIENMIMEIPPNTPSKFRLWGSVEVLASWEKLIVSIMTRGDSIMA
jgi:hypothetical protein